jgi:sialate O-acetylesterase
MVLQRAMKVPLWGTSLPGALILAEVAGMKSSAKADEQGRWRIMLHEMQAGGPYELKLSGDGELTLTDVMVGDVWLASGQSNMGWTLRNSQNAEEEIADANYENMRLFTVPRSISRIQKADLEAGEWARCSPENAADFSAVAYYFGKRLHQEKNVPIGLINCSWGGTPAEAWTSNAMLKALPDFREWVEQVEDNTDNWDQDVAANNERSMKKRELLDHSMAGLKREVHKYNFNDGDWKLMVVPDWDEDIEGIVWLRKRVDVPKEYTDQKLVLDLGRIHRHVTVYFNGQELGTQTHPKYTVMDIPSDLVRKGENRVVLRIYHDWSKPNMEGPRDRMKIRTASGVVIDDLSGTWRYKEDLEPPLPEVKNYYQWPTVLFNGMLAPIIPYGIKGAIWYQGESNAGRAFQYRELFRSMINDWRIRWGQGYFPFLFVQLANYMDPEDEPVDDAWAELREAQMMALGLPRTGMAVTIDIGETFDIHPRNKKDVGDRLALAARHLAYGEDIEFSGPLFRSMHINGNEIELLFDHIGLGLEARDGALTGFAIAGEDRKFYWAKAQIAGGKIIVSSDKVPAPVAVRYGWASNPVCNLYNKNGLPASPFRTDDWPGLTVGQVK